MKKAIIVLCAVVFLFSAGCAGLPKESAAGGGIKYDRPLIQKDEVAVETKTVFAVLFAVAGALGGCVLGFEVPYEPTHWMDFGPYPEIGLFTGGAIGAVFGWFLPDFFSGDNSAEKQVIK